MPTMGINITKSKKGKTTNTSDELSTNETASKSTPANLPPLDVHAIPLPLCPPPVCQSAPTKNKQTQLNLDRDSLLNLNVDNDVILKAWPAEIPKGHIATLPLDGRYIICDVRTQGMSRGKTSMRHPYALDAWKTHIGTQGHKEGVVV